MSFAKAGEPIEKFRLSCGLGLAQGTMYYVGPGSPLGKGQFCGFSHIQMPNGADLASHGIRGSVGPYKSALPQTTHDRLSRFFAQSAGVANIPIPTTLMGLLQLQYEHDSSTIRLQHATRFFVRSHTRSIRALHENQW